MQKSGFSMDSSTIGWRPQSRPDQPVAGHNPRVILRCTPTSGSWLKLVEVVFSTLTRQAIRLGSFDGVNELATAIRAVVILGESIVRMMG